MRPSANRPNVWTRLRIRATGEVPIDELQAYRAAGLEVWTFVEEVAERRRSGEVAPVENLGAWIVFGLQTLGNALMDAEAYVDPATAEYVPPDTYGMILGLYRPIGPWLTRAHQGRVDRDMRLRRKTPLALPAVQEPLLSSLVGVNALLMAVRAMEGELPIVAARPSSEVQGRIEAALVRARYAQGLLPSGDVLGREDLDRLGRPLRKAALELFRAGQIAAYPAFETPRS